jgi:hypothetical protein
MTSEARLWLNGFATVSLVFARDRLAMEEVREALEDDAGSDEGWMAPWRAGLEAGVRASVGN